MNVSDWLIVVATLSGPVLAVQAQKWIERASERRKRKDWVFQTLMATRSARLSPEHVRALNMIELAFYGPRRFSKQSENDRKVIASWREYLDHFWGIGEHPSEDAARAWSLTGDELLINLLDNMGTSLNYEFDRVQLKKGWYSPKAHGNLEADQEAIRTGIASLLAGRTSLKMDVVSFPPAAPTQIP